MLGTGWLLQLGDGCPAVLGQLLGYVFIIFFPSIFSLKEKFVSAGY